MKFKLKPEHKRYFKWEWGIVEGFFIGVLFIVFSQDIVGTSPGFFLVFITQILIILLQIWQGRGRTRILSYPKDSRPRVSRKSGLSSSKLLMCPECGAKAVTKGGKAWIPRHAKGCTEA